MAKTRKRLTAQEWLTVAERFEMASHALVEGRSRDGNLIPAHLTLRSFGVEAYFKCLIELAGRKPTWTHNFSSLFEQLSPRDRRALRTRWGVECGPKLREWNRPGGPFKVPDDLDGVLEACGDAFLVVRYLLEEGEFMPFALLNFPLEIREYIFELKPEYRPAHDWLRRDPKPEFVELKKNDLGASASGWAILNRKAPAFKTTFRRFKRNSNPKNGRSD